jgi:hypothetical protein
MELGIQLHVGLDYPFKKFDQPIDSFHLNCKARGGLFTSTFIDEEEGSEWVQWCIGNNYHLPSYNEWHGWLVYPRKDIKILTVDTIEDMHHVYDNYGWYPIEGSGLEYINFLKIFEEYDAFHITKLGASRTRHPAFFTDDEKTKKYPLRSMYGWDVESTHFANPSAIENVVPVQLNIKLE